MSDDASDADFLGRLRPRATYALGTWAYLRLLGLVHLIAFIDFGLQLPGLIGGRGLLPVRERLAAYAEGNLGFWELPTLAWWGTSDVELHLLWIVGAACGLALMLGWLPRLMVALCFLFYLSLQKAGGPFMAYQWDLLLLEASVVAIALAPWRREPLKTRTGEGPRDPHWLVWAAHAFLFGRLMFASGVVKLASGDPDWASLGAMDLHYWTQPLPNPLSPFVHSLPHWVHATSVITVFVIELGFPLLLLVRGWPRRVGAIGLLALQVLIALTGNFGFFNLLSAAMALPLLDDEWLRTWRFIGKRPGRAERRPARAPTLLLAAATLALGAVPLFGTLFGYQSLPQPVLEATHAIGRFGPGTGYGLFADMTDDRIEWIYEGTTDGRTWEPYALPYQPGDLDRHPGQAAPRMPRLDWSLWFAALGSPSHQKVAQELQGALQRAEPSVLDLLAHDPFDGETPRAVRVRRFRYRFANDPDERDVTAATIRGETWRRTPVSRP